MKHSLALALFLSLSAVGNELPQISEVNLEALEQAFDLDGARDLDNAKGACGQIKLTDTQKKSLKTAFIGNKKAQIQSEANLKIAGLDYIVALTDSAGTKLAADTASTALSASMAKMASNHMGLANEILFDILTADQRRPALICMHEIHKMMAAAKLKKLCTPKPAPQPNPKP